MLFQFGKEVVPTLNQFGFVLIIDKLELMARPMFSHLLQKYF